MSATRDEPERRADSLAPPLNVNAFLDDLAVVTTNSAIPFRELARRAGCSVTTIGNIARRRAVPRFDIAIRVANQLGYTFLFMPPPLPSSCRPGELASPPAHRPGRPRGPRKALEPHG